MKHLIFLILCFQATVYSTAQETEFHQLKNEVNVATGVALDNHLVFMPGIHIEYVRNLHHRLGIGCAFETFIAKNLHPTFSIVLQYKFTPNLIFEYNPGITLNQNQDQVLLFSQHLELAYNFELSNFIIGPQIEFGAQKKHLHSMLGIHVGKHF